MTSGREMLVFSASLDSLQVHDSKANKNTRSSESCDRLLQMGKNNKVRSFERTSFSTPRDTLTKWKKRIPRYGMRSKVITKLIEQFLDGNVAVIIDGRQI